ncbi:MAG TPA: PAS domain S-box protein [Dongiaceae bacterium]|nr:PAS domain S-box protein [Dongiaceae bacterium]
MPELGRILLGGVGCFLLAWIPMGFAAIAGGWWLWLVDALLIFLVLDRSGRTLAIDLAVAAMVILLAYFLVAHALTVPALVLAAASILHVAVARLLLVRFAPDAAQLETAGALAHLLLWCALLSPIAGALVLAGAALPGHGWLSATQLFVEWWVASAVGTAVLLPFVLSLAHSAPIDPRLLLTRWREVLLVLALVALVAAMTRALDGVYPLLLGLPVVLWAALRLDFRSTSLLCVMLAMLPIAGAALRAWPLPSPGYDVVFPAPEQRAYLLAVILPALFASLFTQEQRAGERSRQAALQALRAVMDAVPSAILTLTPAGKVGLWSRGAERVFGWRRAEVEGSDPPYLAPENAAQAASLRQRVLAGNEIQNQTVQRRNQAGETRELVVNAVPQRDADGTITGIIAVMDDVTDRRRVEASREEHRARLAAILDAVADPIITSDEEGTITSFSRAAEAVFGYAASEAIGRNLSMLMPEPDCGRHDSYLRRYRETGVARIIGASRQVTGQRKDGGVFPAEITISEAWLDGRRIFAGIVRDLSLKPFAAVQGQARPADPATAKFLSKITHDLRQPLHALSLMTGALERRVEDPEAHELVDHLSQIVRSTQATFENLVEWTRIESGLIGTVPTTISAGDILASLAQEFEAEAECRNLAVRHIPSRAIIACDPALVRRILRQLLDNAMKFTASGGVLIGARRHGSMLRLTVVDTGIGIPADQQDFIFVEYNQLDSGREAGGLGLGLAIARRRAALAGLEIGIRSMPRKGSTFWIEVPLAG